MGDAKGGARSARAGTRASNTKTGVRRRAVGTRDRVTSYLGSVSGIADPSGMASTRLAEAVGYPGSSVAFAQLLSGMERDGLITREVRGKRTYRITLAPGVAPGRAHLGRAGLAANGHPEGAAIRAAEAGITALPADGDLIPAVIGLPAPSAQAFDYDELARRLLVQVIRRLATPGEGGGGVVADLERELAAARSRASALTAENRRLREQLNHAQVSLDQVRRSLDGTGLDLAEEAEQLALTRTGAVGRVLSDAEVVLLERLVSGAAEDVPDDAAQLHPDATAS